MPSARPRRVRIWINAAMAVVLAFATGGAASGQGFLRPERETARPETSSLRRFPDVSWGVPVFAPALPAGLTKAQLRFVAEHYSGAEQVSREEAEAIRAINPDFIILHSRRAFIAGPKPYYMGDAWGSDWEAIEGRWDWFVRATDGRPIRHLLADGYLMDPWDELAETAEQGWAAYWVDSSMEQMRRMDADGIRALDYDPGSVLAALLDPPDWKFDAERMEKHWTPRVNRFGQYVRERFSSSPEKYLLVVDGGGLADTGLLPDFSPADGVLVEPFAGRQSGSPGADLSGWKLQMSRVMTLQQREKAVLCRGSLPEGAGTMDRLFITGSFLLAQSGRAQLYLQKSSASILEYYPEYLINLGHPMSTGHGDVEGYYRRELGLFAREFEKGWVLVNPGDQSIPLRLDRAAWSVSPQGGGSLDASGSHSGVLLLEKVESITLPPAAAAVLITNRATSLFPDPRP
ncbi:MAG: hypothetical protein HY650_05185 [Acidobacteria bacterium]|nr:hypothetical protein [Acidobacteriota bacterium]